MKYSPLSVGNNINDCLFGSSWPVPVRISDSPNCIFAEAHHQNREMARQRAEDIASAVNGYVATREALAGLLAMLDDPHGEPGEAEQVIMHARNVLERGK